jgi:hypothetical protein
MNIRVAAVVLAVFLIPTNYAAIRQQYLPNFIPPSMFFGTIILIAIVARLACRPEPGSIIPRRLAIPYLTLVPGCSSPYCTARLRFWINQSYRVWHDHDACLFCLSVYASRFCRVDSFLRAILFLGILLAALAVTGVFHFFRPDSEEQTMGTNYLPFSIAGGNCRSVLLHLASGCSKAFIWIITL